MPKIDPKTGERIEEGSPQIDPATGERLATAAPAKPEQQGFFSSASDSSGLTSLVHAVMHPIKTLAPVAGLLNDAVHLRPASDTNPLVQAVQGGARQTTDNAKKAVKDFKAGGLNLQTRRDIGNALPLIGGSLQKGEEQTDAGNESGALGTILGLGAGIVGPKLAGMAAAPLLNKVAPVLAETALKVRGADRGFGATPGRAILDHTEGFTPQKVVDSARSSMKDLQAKQTSALTGASGTVDLTPTRNVAADFATKAADENHLGTIKDIGKLGEQVHTDALSGQPLPVDVTPLRAASLNRGISNAKASWNPATTNDTMSAAAGMMHHTLGEGIASVVPEVRPINQAMQSLSPVIQRATAADLNAGIMQRVMGRIASPTGALLGGAGGYELGGIPGAIAGLVLPEVISNPTTIMAAARATNGLGKIGSSTPLMPPLFGSRKEKK